MAYSRAENFLYFEFSTDVYERVREEFKTELEHRRALRPLEERLERQKAREFRRAEERRLRKEWRRDRIGRGIESLVLDRRENSAPPGQLGYKADLLRLHGFVHKRGRIGCIAGWLFSGLKRSYPEEYRELVAERDVHHQTKRGACLALDRDRISQESCAAAQHPGRLCNREPWLPAGTAGAVGRGAFAVGVGARHQHLHPHGRRSAHDRTLRSRSRPRNA